MSESGGDIISVQRGDIIGIGIQVALHSFQHLTVLVEQVANRLHRRI